jgi:hypothetical protein
MGMGIQTPYEATQLLTHGTGHIRGPKPLMLSIIRINISSCVFIKVDDLNGNNTDFPILPISCKCRLGKKLSNIPYNKPI